MKGYISRRSAVIMMAAVAVTPSAAVKAENLPTGFRADANSTDSFDWLLPALKTFLGESTGDYISREELVALGYDPKPGPDNRLYLYDQIAGFFFSPPELRVIMPNGDRILESSWPHFAVRRAIIVTEGNSTRILTVALLLYATPNTKKDEHRSLIVFEPSKQPDLNLVVDELRQFVGHEVHQETAMFGQRLFKGESSLKVFVVPLRSNSASQ